ncbi:MAG: hypothetical protein IT443_00460 [Phycisphaeraceae bacterium]|nr:hypothetical protein [Phycisphaeraceae bacterium]
MTTARSAWLGMLGTVLFCLPAVPTTAATLFFTTHGPGENPVFSNPTLTLVEDQVASLYLWARLGENEVINGLGLDIMGRGNQAVIPLRHSIANPAVDPIAHDSFFADEMEDIKSLGVKVDRRWMSVSQRYMGWDVPDEQGTYKLVRQFRAFTVGFGGLTNESAANDPTYDPDLDAFLISRLTLKAEAPGTVEVYLQTNWWTISYATAQGGPEIQYGVNDDPVDCRDAYVRSARPDATIAVLPSASQIVPEPPSLLIVAWLAAISMTRYRRAI